MLTDGRTTDDGVTDILIAHLGAFGSGELKIEIENISNPRKFCQRGPTLTTFLFLSSFF